MSFHIPDTLSLQRFRQIKLQVRLVTRKRTSVNKRGILKQAGTILEYKGRAQHDNAAPRYGIVSANSSHSNSKLPRSNLHLKGPFGDSLSTRASTADRPSIYKLGGISSTHKGDRRCKHCNGCNDGGRKDLIWLE